MSTAIQSFANITGQCTDISALAAHYPDFNLRQITFQQLYLVYNQRLGFQLHILTFSSQIISAFTIYLTSRENRRNLFYPADKTLQGFLYQLAGDMFRRIYSFFDYQFGYLYFLSFERHFVCLPYISRYTVPKKRFLSYLVF